MKKISLLFLIFFLFSVCSFSQTPPNPWTPPEYFPAKAVLIEWDFNNTIWPLYSELIKECREVVEVILVVRDQGEENTMRSKLIADSVSLTNISFVHVPCERMWIRDHGPLAIMTDNGMAFIDLDDLASSGLDEDLPTNLANAWSLDSYQLPYVFCGGNFMVNNSNTLFTTERVYTANASYTQAQIETAFQNYFGITDIITISSQHSDYWGHIDMQIKLLDDTTFVVASVDPASGPNYDTLENNFARLSQLTSPYGTPYRIRRLPMADNWKTYANSLMLNNKVLLPVYNHPRDSIAIQVYQELLPQHDIVGINCNPIIGWEGAIHCITMQLFDDTQITAIKNISVKENGIGIFPNPVQQNETLNIMCAVGNAVPYKAEIFNIKGQMIESVELKNKTQPCTLTWRHEAGVFTIVILYNDGSVCNTTFISK